MNETSMNIEIFESRLKHIIKIAVLSLILSFIIYLLYLIFGHGEVVSAGYFIKFHSGTVISLTYFFFTVLLFNSYVFSGMSHSGVGNGTMEES